MTRRLFIALAVLLAAPPAGATPPAGGRGPQGPIVAAWFIVIKQ